MTRAWVLRASLALALAAATAATQGNAATSSTVVGAFVPSATTVDASGCAPVLAGRTEFGAMLPGSTTTTTSDCLITFGSSNDTASLRLRQADDAGSAMWATSNGAADPTFDGDGLLTLDPSAGADAAFGLVSYPDGRVLVAGVANSSTAGRSYFARRLSSGAVDPSFGDGVNPVLFDFLVGRDEMIKDVLVAPDGSIFALGEAPQSPREVYVVKLHPDGSLDTTFDGDGYRVVAPMGSADQAQAIALGSDGTLYASAVGYGTGRVRTWIHALDQSGAPIAWWGTSGIATVDDGSDDWVGRNMVLDGDGKLVVTGWESVAGARTAIVARLDRRGSLDASFATGGINKLSSIPGPSYMYGIALRPGGGYAVSGNGKDGASAAAYGAWITSTGALDTSRGGGDGAGFMTRTTSSESADLAMVVDGDDQLVMGYHIDQSGALDTVAGRLRTDGTSDPTWGTAGVMSLASGPGADYAWATAFGVDGAIYFTGSSATPGTIYVRRVRSNALADFSGSWAGASSAFGTCLRAAPGASPSWGVGTGNACSTTIPGDWRAIPTAASEIARTASTASGQAALRFALHVGTAQAPGRYLAPIQFEVVAPA